jgi:hypothetical protein
MRDIEDFAESAVRLIAVSDISDTEKITLIHNVYKFHDSWDTSFTMMRVFDELVECGYLFLFSLSDHPEYLEYTSYFTQIAKEDFAFIYNDIETQEGVGCYWVGKLHRNGKKIAINKLCSKAGTTLWNTFLQDAEQPAEINGLRMILRLAELAEASEDLEMLGTLYYISLYFLLDKDTGSLKYLENLKEFLLSDRVMAAFNESANAKRLEMPEEDASDNIREWISYYFDWLRRSPKKKKGTPEDLEKYKAAVAKGNPELSFELYALLQESSIGANMPPPDSELLDNLSEKTLRRLMEYDEDEITDERLKSFVSAVKELDKNTNSLDYFIEKSMVLINNSDFKEAIFYVAKGLVMEPDNPMLRLNDAYISVILPRAARVREAIDTLGELIKEIPQYEALIRYLRGMGFYRLDDEAGKNEMLIAAGLDPAYRKYYEYYYLQK